jgi:hypothetical protein
MRTIQPRLGFPLALAAMLSMGLPSISPAAAEPTVDLAASAGQKPVEELQELDEIWVHGQSLARRIAKAENAFFYRYNKINRKADYRVSCGYFTLDRGSMVMRRNCTPAFMEPTWMLESFGTSYGGCGNERYVSEYIKSERSDRGYPCSIMEIAQSRRDRLDPFPVVRPVIATPAQRKQYATHVMKLILTDDELRAKAEALAVLYEEFDETQAQYQKAKVIAPPAKPRRGPRS